MCNRLLRSSTCSRKIVTIVASQMQSRSTSRIVWKNSWRREQITNERSSWMLGTIRRITASIRLPKQLQTDSRLMTVEIHQKWQLGPSSSRKKTTRTKSSTEGKMAAWHQSWLETQSGWSRLNLKRSRTTQSTPYSGNFYALRLA